MDSLPGQPRPVDINALFEEPKKSRGEQIFRHGVMPVLSVLETILTSRASKGAHVGSSALEVMKGLEAQDRYKYEQRQKSLDRMMDLQDREAAKTRDNTLLGFQKETHERAKKTYEGEQTQKANAAKLRQKAIDKIIGKPAEVDAQGVEISPAIQGIEGLTELEKVAAEADPIEFLISKLKPAPTQLVVGGDGTYEPIIRTTGKTPDGRTVKAPPPRPVGSSKTLEQITAEAEARAKGALAGAGEKPLSGDAAKLAGFVSTLQTQGQLLKKLIQEQGIQKVTLEYKKGNPAVANIIEDMADAKGRLRSGGAVNVDEADRFKQPFTGLGNLFYADDKAALAAVDQALAEAANVQGGMGRTQPPAEAPPPTTPGNPGVDKKAMAQQALNDPEATDEERAAAKRILGIP